MTVTGDVTQTASGILNINMTSSTTNDQVVVTGTFTADGTLNVTNSSGSFSIGQAVTVVVASAVSGTFDTLNLPALSGGQS